MVIKSVGVQGIQQPEKECQDTVCPFHGTLRVRGMIVEAVVVQKRASNTVVVQREYAYYNRKYQRYERRRSRLRAHLSPCVEISEGDKVVIGETRPISKSVSFVVLGRRGLVNG
ncbi:MAG: 30S ribosomal protein S17 [Candidatus Marsarchaeota archaeon]|nr:30S ribosomal protein S17 [Candidatus Marsarchaeota archaeon]